MKPVILMTGHTFGPLQARLGDFEAWFARIAGWSVDRFTVIDAIGGAPLPGPASVEPVIVTGSAASVHHRAEWSVRAGEWLRAVVVADIPVLGVCYGHQLLGDVFGGEVGPNPNGREVGVCDVTTDDHPLFYGLPPRFAVYQTHTDAVNRAPAEATVLGGNEICPVQAMQLGSAVSVQWHPEFNAEIIRHYIEARAHLIDEEGGVGTAARLAAEVVELDCGPHLMRNFLERCT